MFVKNLKKSLWVTALFALSMVHLFIVVRLLYDANKISSYSVYQAVLNIMIIAIQYGVAFLCAVFGFWMTVFFSMSLWSGVTRSMPQPKSPLNMTLGVWGAVHAVLTLVVLLLANEEQPAATAILMISSLVAIGPFLGVWFALYRLSKNETVWSDVKRALSFSAIAAWIIFVVCCVQVFVAGSPWWVLFFLFTAPASLVVFFILWIIAYFVLRGLRRTAT